MRMLDSESALMLYMVQMAISTQRENNQAQTQFVLNTLTVVTYFQSTNVCIDIAFLV
uniref:Uncharacterized protein n=1 Tax=Helianthus annuus TaxID=4232 RepID=A0A251T7T8_HELAN